MLHCCLSRARCRLEQCALLISGRLSFKIGRASAGVTLSSRGRDVDSRHQAFSGTSLNNWQVGLAFIGARPLRDGNCALTRKFRVLNGRK